MYDAESKDNTFTAVKNMRNEIEKTRCKHVIVICNKLDLAAVGHYINWLFYLTMISILNIELVITQPNFNINYNIILYFQPPGHTAWAANHKLEYFVVSAKQGHYLEEPMVKLVSMLTGSSSHHNTIKRVASRTSVNLTFPPKFPQ